jgi:tetratricopeptide (TPR) repeat protein
VTPERWVQLRSLFDQALAVDAPGRQAFVFSMCGGDAQLERSLIALLDYHDRSGITLDGPQLPTNLLAEIVAADLRAFAPGDIVAARFRVERFIAEGGMGEVYDAADLELSERVALKTIRPMLAGEEAVLTRFKQEILLARRVTHRNVSRVYDLFRHERGDGSRAVVFLSMELLEGETLAQRIRRVGPLPPSEALAIALQLTSGLEAAHAVGIIHRDFTSGNVVLAPESDGAPGERAVVMDFGLAATLRTVQEDQGRGNFAAGTPAYMAPEQVENSCITAAADIYALGVVLFEMIAGHVPFRATSPLATAQLRLHREAPSLKSVAPAVSRDWDRSVRACLQRDPQRRPPSPAAVADLLTGRARRRRTGYAVVALLGAALLSAGAWRWTHLPYRPAPAAQMALDTAMVKRANVTNNGFASSISDFKRAIALDPNWGRPWAELAYTFAAGANTQQIPAAVASPEARAAALQAIRRDARSAKAFGALGWVQSLDLDDWPNAESNLRRATTLDPDDAQLHYWLSVHLRKTGKFADAEREVRAAMALSHQREPLYWWELAFLYWTSNQLDRMDAFMRELLIAYPNFGFTRFLNARLLKEEGRYDDALNELRFSEALQYAPVTVEVERASIDAYRGQVDAARIRLDRLREMSRKQPVDTLLIAGVYARLGDANAAFDWLEEGYARRDSTVLSIATSPLLTPLHSDIRFARLMERLHFKREARP